MTKVSKVKNFDGTEYTNIFGHGLVVDNTHKQPVNNAYAIAEDDPYNVIDWTEKTDTLSIDVETPCHNELVVYFIGNTISLSDNFTYIGEWPDEFTDEVPYVLSVVDGIAAVSEIN